MDHEQEKTASQCGPLSRIFDTLMGHFGPTLRAASQPCAQRAIDAIFASLVVEYALACPAS